MSHKKSARHREKACKSSADDRLLEKAISARRPKIHTSCFFYKFHTRESLYKLLSIVLVFCQRNELRSVSRALGLIPITGMLEHRGAENLWKQCTDLYKDETEWKTRRRKFIKSGKVLTRLERRFGRRTTPFEDMFSYQEHFCPTQSITRLRVDVALITPYIKRYFVQMGYITPGMAFDLPLENMSAKDLHCTPVLRTVLKLSPRKSAVRLCAMFVSDPVVFLRLAMVCKETYVTLMAETSLHQYLEYSTIVRQDDYSESQKKNFLMLVLEWNCDAQVYATCMRVNRETWALLNLTTIWSRNIYFYLNPEYVAGKFLYTQEDYRQKLIFCPAHYVTNLVISPMTYGNTGFSDADGTLDHFVDSLRKKFMPNLRTTILIERLGTLQTFVIPPGLNWNEDTEYPLNRAIRFCDHHLEYSNNVLRTTRAAMMFFGAKSSWLKFPDSKKNIALIARITRNAANERIHSDDTPLITIRREFLDDLLKSNKDYEMLCGNGMLRVEFSDDGESATLYQVRNVERYLKTKSSHVFN